MRSLVARWCRARSEANNGARCRSCRIVAVGEANRDLSVQSETIKDEA